MKKFFSLALLFSSLVVKINADSSNWVMPMMVPVVCKAAECITKDPSASKDDMNLSSCCGMAAEGSACSLVLMAMNNSNDMNAMLVDSALNTAMVGAQKVASSKVKMMSEMCKKPLYRTMLTCLGNILCKTAYSAMTSGSSSPMPVVKK